MGRPCLRLAAHPAGHGDNSPHKDVCSSVSSRPTLKPHQWGISLVLPAPRIGISLSRGPLLGPSPSDVPGVEMCNDYTSNTRILTLQIPWKLGLPAQPHITPLASRAVATGISLVCVLVWYLSPHWTLGFVSARATAGLFAAPSWVPSKPQRDQARPGSLPWAICSLGDGGLIYIYFFNCQNKIIKIVICFEV